MCATCGCAGDGGQISRFDEDGHGGDEARKEDGVEPHAHRHPHVHPHAHDEAHGNHHQTSSPATDVRRLSPPMVKIGGKVVNRILAARPERSEVVPAFAPDASTDSVRLKHLEEQVIAKNTEVAEHVRTTLASRHVFALNLISSPGSGKTTLLERTLRMLGKEVPVAVIEGDQETRLDAQRIRAAGAPAVQVNTGTGCHLDASMIERALPALPLRERSILFIENVGNLVCPALFDLGEASKVVIASVTEGDDKPLKYPHVFRASRLFVLNKIDLLPWVPFDVDRCIRNARRLNPELEVLQLSALRGDGMEEWCEWVLRHAAPTAGAPGREASST